MRRLAHNQHVSLSEAVRRLVDRGLKKRDGKPTGARALLELAGIGHSGLPDLGQNHDRYLAELDEW